MKIFYLSCGRINAEPTTKLVCSCTVEMDIKILHVFAVLQGKRFPFERKKQSACGERNGVVIDQKRAVPLLDQEYFIRLERGMFAHRFFVGFEYETGNNQLVGKGRYGELTNIFAWHFSYFLRLSLLLYCIVYYEK